MAITLDGTTGITASDGLVYTRGNILGTVTQSAGVPTGAIIESGSNANGEYVKYADGTMICWNYALTTQASSTATGNMFRTATVSTWTFPVTFLVDPVVSGQADATGRILTIDPASVSAVDFRQHSASSSGTLVGNKLTATGQWF
jgi:hypothetical protein